MLEHYRSEIRVSVSSAAALILCATVEWISTHPENPPKPPVSPLPHLCLQCQLVTVNHSYSHVFPPPKYFTHACQYSQLFFTSISLCSHGWGCITSFLTLLPRAHLLGSKVTSHSVKRTPPFLRSVYLEIVNNIEKAKRTVVICNPIAQGGSSSINISSQFSGIFYRLNHITMRQIIKK